MQRWRFQLETAAERTTVCTGWGRGIARYDPVQDRKVEWELEHHWRRSRAYESAQQCRLPSVLPDQQQDDYEGEHGTNFRNRRDWVGEIVLYVSRHQAVLNQLFPVSDGVYD